MKMHVDAWGEPRKDVEEHIVHIIAGSRGVRRIHEEYFVRF